MFQMRITAQYPTGANGAGKTTTISILTGMMAPTSGDALIYGRSILGGMKYIRQNLGVCPQFDILWPDITVREHLELYCAIKGYAFQASKAAAVSAAHSVGERTILNHLHNIRCPLLTYSYQSMFSTCRSGFKYKQLQGGMLLRPNVAEVPDCCMTIEVDIVPLMLSVLSQTL